MTYMPSDFYHSCKPGKCPGYVADSPGGLHVPVLDGTFDWQQQVVKNFLNTVHATFHQDFTISVLGNEVCFEKVGSTISTKYGPKRGAGWKDILTIKDMINGNMMLLYDGTKIVMNAPSLEKLHSVLKAAEVVIVRKFSPFKALIGPSKDFISRLGEFDLVKSLASDGDISYRDTKLQPGTNLEEIFKELVPIKELDEILTDMRDEGCIYEDVFRTGAVMVSAVEANTNNKRMVANVISITHAIIQAVQTQRMVTNMQRTLVPGPGGMVPMSEYIDEPHKLKFSEDSCIECVGTPNEQIYDYGFDGQLMCIEYIESFNEAVKILAKDDYTRTITEMYTKLIRETGLNDAVKGYRVTRKRYKKPKEEVV